uniref:Jacalin-type lectin domain-containing protein n=1 Tax=Oryzias latipes TaxID=8090 RepID=A0A3B3HHQ6_ORYLA
MSYLAPVLTIGGQGGRSFSFTGESNGATLKKLWVCVREWQVRGIKVWLTDGQVQEFGEPEGGFSQMEFQDGEQIKSLSLWGNGAGTRLGTIRIRTTLSQEFFPKMTKWNLKKEYPIDVGSGICLGVLGKGGDDIDILQDTVCRRLYQPGPTLHPASPGLPGTYARILFLDFSLAFNTIFPSLLQEKFLQLKVADSTCRWITDFLTDRRQCVRLDSLGFVFINIGRATVDLPYMAKVKITCYNGKTLKFNTSGIYKCVTYTNAKTIVTENNKSLTH